MSGRPSKKNKINLAIRSKVQLPERIALEAVLKVLQSGHKSGLLPESGLYVQWVSTSSGVIVYIKEMTPNQYQYCLSRNKS